MNVSGTLPPMYRDQGWTLEEPDDHMLELRGDGHLIAIWMQCGVTVEEIMAEIQRQQTMAELRRQQL